MIHFQALITAALIHNIDLYALDPTLCEVVNLPLWLDYDVPHFNNNRYSLTPLLLLKILRFSSQCLHQKVEFSAFGLFTVDFSMILTASYNSISFPEYKFCLHFYLFHIFIDCRRNFYIFDFYNPMFDFKI